MAAFVRRAALAAAFLGVAVATAPVEEALGVDDECAAGAPCALEALQMRKEAKAAEAKGEAPAISHEALLQAMKADGVPEEHLEQARAELALVATLSAEEIEARSNATCASWTGGTCVTSDCAASRGATECSSFRCVCRKGFCEHNGVCTFNSHHATQSYGGWGAPSPSWGAPSPSWGAPSPSWGMPGMSPGMPGMPGMPAGGSPWAAPAPSWGAMGGWGTPGASYGQPAAASGSQSRDTGGTCMLGGCDLSRGHTRCSMKTGYKCMCRQGSHAVNGVCVGATGGWR